MFNPQNTKIVFMGTSQFAIPCLLKLMEKNYNIAGIVTQPDKPSGRKKKLTPPPIKLTAQNYNLTVFQFEKLDDDATKKIKNLDPDIIILVAYGKILPKKILDIPPHGVINLHPSLLPQYRGPTPIQEAILDGQNQTGVSIIKLDEKTDHGPIIAQKKLEILEDDNNESLSNSLACEGADFLIKVLPDYLQSKLTPKEQSDKFASYTKLISPQDTKINWKKSPLEIYHQIRAYSPRPGAWTDITGKRVKILKASLNENGELEIDEVQPPGKKKMPYSEYLKGNEPLV